MPSYFLKGGKKEKIETLNKFLKEQGFKPIEQLKTNYASQFEQNQWIKNQETPNNEEKQQPINEHNLNNEKAVAVLKKTTPGGTYLVQGSDDVDTHYWYFFQCEDVSNERLVGSDLADFEGEQYQSWHMNFDEMSDTGGGITSIEEMSFDEFMDRHPEYFL